MVNLFKNDTMKVPKKDSMIVRVDMEQQDIGGRKSHLPNAEDNEDMEVEHTPSPNGTD